VKCEGEKGRGKWRAAWRKRKREKKREREEDRGEESRGVEVKDDTRTRKERAGEEMIDKRFFFRLLVCWAFAWYTVHSLFSMVRVH
jgi:hypothetical protein